MGETKQRDFMFDAFRGLLIWCIPISHFTRVAGHFSAASLGGIVYITINVFVMQAFVFLSGYFSKKPDRARQTAFKTFLWPYILCIPFFYFVKLIIFGHASIDLLIPPFALWYLFALFFYRFFLKDYIRIPHILEISVIIYIIAGLIPFLSKELALGRMFSYFPFFLLGYYCTPEHLAKLRSLKRVHCIILGAALLAVSCLLAFKVPQLPVGFYLLKEPAASLGISWYWDILGRLLIFVLACGWILLMINILPKKKNYLTYVGVTTMPIYIFHLVVRYLVKKYSITFGILPDNWFVYYVMIFGLASLCVVVFSSKPVARAYDFVVDGSYSILIWLLNKLQAGLGVVHEPLLKFVNGTVNYINRVGNYETKISLFGNTSVLKRKQGFSSSSNEENSGQSGSGRQKKGKNKRNADSSSLKSVEIELEGLENLSNKPVTGNSIISMGFSEFGSSSADNTKNHQTAANKPDTGFESDLKKYSHESPVSEGSEDSNNDSTKSSNTHQDTDSYENSDAVKSTDSYENSDAVQDTDSDKNYDAVQDADSDKNYDAVKNTDSYENSDAAQDADSDKSPDFGQNSGSEADYVRSTENNSSDEESPELSFFDISDIDAYLKSKSDKSPKKEKSEDDPDKKSSSDKA